MLSECAREGEPGSACAHGAWPLNLPWSQELLFRFIEETKDSRTIHAVSRSDQGLGCAVNHRALFSAVPHSCTTACKRLEWGTLKFTDYLPTAFSSGRGHESRVQDLYDKKTMVCSSEIPGMVAGGCHAGDWPWPLDNVPLKEEKSMWRPYGANCKITDKWMKSRGKAVCKQELAGCQDHERSEPGAG